MGEARRAETPAAAFGVTWAPCVRMLVCPWWASCEALLGVLTDNFEFVLGASLLEGIGALISYIEVRIGSIMGFLGTLLGCLEPLWGLFWGVVWPSWAALGPSRTVVAPFEGPLGALWPVLRLSWKALGSPRGL